jgi:hypothetical protein
VQAQIHLTVIRARAELVSARTALVNAARGLVKSYGQRLPKCGTQQVGRELAAAVSPELREVLEPVLKEIESLNERIKEYDARMEKIAKEVYPEVSLLKQVKGVGTQIALTYVLTIEDPHRFLKSREVGCFLGLKPGRRNSGESEPQKRISKEGDRYLRTMMVQGAHYILGPFGEDSDLRRWGLKLAERGGKNAKKRAVVAVASVKPIRDRMEGRVRGCVRPNRRTQPQIIRAGRPRKHRLRTGPSPRIRRAAWLTLLLRLRARHQWERQIQIAGLRVHGVLDGSLVGPDFNRCTDRNEFVNFFDLRVGHGDASCRPVHLTLQRSHPGIFRFQPVDLHIASGIHS